MLPLVLHPRRSVAFYALASLSMFAAIGPWSTIKINKKKRKVEGTYLGFGTLPHPLGGPLWSRSFVVARVLELS